MTTNPYDVYLGDKASLQGYRCRSLARDSAPQIAPRFSSGAAGETDLDLLKSASVENLSGGMFQRTHTDNQMVARGVGYYNAYDELFYPTVPTSAVTGTAFAGSVQCKIDSESYGFVCFYQRSGGFSYNGITKFVGNVATNLTVPAALYAVAAVTVVTSMCLHKGYLYVASDIGNIQRLNIAANTWQDVAGVVRILFELRGVLYGINSANTLYSATNEFAAGSATYTALTQVGGTEAYCTSAVEYNGAAWITKSDGIYRFDGVTVVKVLPFNATNLTVWNGALYFMVGKWLYKFDGTNITKLQYFIDSIYQITSTPFYLVLQTWITTSYNDSPKLPSSTGYTRIYAFDGAGFEIILEKDVTPETTYDHAIVYSSNTIIYSQPEFNGAAWDNNQLFAVLLSNMFTSSAVTSASQIDITTSEHDDGFPNILKSLEFVEPLYYGMVAGDVITVKYQLYDGKTWGSWVTLGTLTSTSVNRLEITDYNNKLYKRVKINVYVSTMTAASTLTFKGVSWRYTLQPRMRWRWQAQLSANGNANITDRTGATITTNANQLTNVITQATKQKTPVYFCSPDYGQVKTTVNSAAISVDVKGQLAVYTDPYSEYQLVAIKNNSGVWEILQVSAVSYSSGTDTTTLTLLARGYLGITAAQLTAGAEVRLCYKVYVNRLIRESVDMSEGTYSEQLSSGASQMQREFVLELIEV